MQVTCERYHDFSAGHRVVGHEGKCALLHGHNYRVTFICEAEKLDDVGRVIDFSCIKGLLCDWLEEHWDHRFLMWNKDNLCHLLFDKQNQDTGIIGSLVIVPFNPTAENMAIHLLSVVGPAQLSGTGVRLRSVRIDETRKCSATVTL